jgi:multisubunit Na+/H+ antiporter MnhG subunit
MCEIIGKNVLFGGAFIVEVALIPFHLIEDAYYRADTYMKPKKRW